jgi:hypothetical protein
MRIMLVGVQFKLGEIEAGRQNASLLCPGRSSLEPKLQKALDQLKACEDAPQG